LSLIQELFYLLQPRTISAVAAVLVLNIFNIFMERSLLSIEAYDERDNRNAQLYFIIYNLLASCQDDFGTTFFPTIVINFNEIGVIISVKLFYVYNNFKRSVISSLAQFGRKNIIRAYADLEILNE
jgi:hypothetical protein